jgi:hypothetical protein
MSVRDCFISHASEDKEAVARPLAHALKGRGYEVWFDEFELEPGDSLPRKIDEGLAGSRFGVVVLSEKFFAKNWTKLELDALVARQMVGSERIILPVWHGIDEDYLEVVSPTLASIVGVPSAPLDVAVERIAKRIDRRRDSGSSGAALVSAQESKPAPPESDLEKLVNEKKRVKLGYSDLEKRKFAPDGAGGHYDRGPGWFSVIVGPASLRDDMIDPTELPLERLRDLEIDDQWYREVLCNRRGLRAGLDGFVHRFPEDPSDPPIYWLKIWQDGLLEYGESLTLSVDEKMVIPYISIAQKIHDYVLLFTEVLRMVSYLGDTVAIAALSDVNEFELGVPLRYDLDSRQFDVDQILSRPLRASILEMPAATNAWLKKTMDRFFLAGGIASGAFFIAQDGILDDYK